MRDGDRGLPQWLPPFTPEAVIFDLDGVLVDSEHAWAEAEQAALYEFGGIRDPSLSARLLGCDPAQAAVVLAEAAGGVDAGELGHRIHAEVTRRLEAEVHACPGALSIVGALRGRIPVGVATNSPRSIADIVLDATDLASLLDVVVCRDDVARGKPDPDLYLAACRQAGVLPSASVAVEDSAAGLAAAAAAGLWTIGCSARLDPTSTEAHAVIASLLEIDADLFFARRRQEDTR